MKNNEIININGIDYEYSEYYKKLNIVDESKSNVHVLCPLCLNSLFSLRYGDYELIAQCSCGHEMTVYDG